MCFLLPVDSKPTANKMSVNKSKVTFEIEQWWICAVLWQPFWKLRPVEICQCRKSIRDIIIYLYIKFWWYRTMLSFAVLWRPFWKWRPLEIFQCRESIRDIIIDNNWVVFHAVSIGLRYSLSSSNRKWLSYSLKIAFKLADDHLILRGGWQFFQIHVNILAAKFLEINNLASQEKLSP